MLKSFPYLFFDSLKLTTTKSTTTPPTKSILKNTTTLKSNKNPLKRQEALLKSQTTCSFWPHCGACNANTMPRPNNKIDSKRQMSLQEQQQFALNGQRRAEAGELALRRYHSERAPSGCEEYDALTPRIEHSSYPAPSHNTNISTVSVNSNFNAPTHKTQSTSKCRGSGAKVTKNNGTVTGVTRSKTQWTLLCSGASLMDCIEDSTRAKATTKLTTANKTKGRAINESAYVAAASNNDTLTATKATSIAAKSSSLPLTGASSIFLGECEMPITREYGTSKRYNRESLERERERSRDRNRERELEWERQCALDYYRQPVIYREISGVDDNRTINEIQNNENYDVNVYNERYNLNYAQQPTAGEYAR